MQARNEAANRRKGKDDEDDFLEIDLGMLFKAVLTRWKLCMAICILVCGLAFAYCYTAVPVYLASCRMLVESGSLKVTQIQDVYNSEFGKDTQSRNSFMQTQIKLITSDNILAKVFEHFKFADRDEFALAKEPLRALENRIVIKQIPNTSLLDIGFKDPDATFSAMVANYVARVYMEDSSQRASGFSRLGLEKLQDELVNMEGKRVKAIAKLNDYKKKHDILSVDAAQKLEVQRLATMDVASISAKESLATAQSTVAAIEAWRKQGLRLDSLPEAIANPTLTQF
ncbi:MAG: hypothetical protein HUK26_09340, partial [Duodenibacillus sp.]|nr:hypothetical protein [Duodenibacillus sp.]